MKFILLIIVIPVFLFFFVRFLEHKSIYFPFRHIEDTPKKIDLTYEDVNLITVDGVQLHGWFIPSRNPRATVLFSHGNGGNISHRLEKILILNELNIDILIYDYRGYGRSKGKPSENGIYLDILTMYEYLTKERGVSSESIIAYGESLGGAVAIELAARYQLGGVIIEDSFTSIKDMAAKYFPFIPAFLFKSKFNSLGKIKAVTSPKLIFHSIQDEIVPFEQGKRLYENAPEPKEFVTLQGGHNDAFLVSRDLFAKTIDVFVDKYLK